MVATIVAGLLVIHPSSDSASSTVVGSITDNNPIIDSSCLKYDLVLLGLYLFPMI